MTADAAHWQRRLDELATEHEVPGASLAILDAGELSAAAAGVVNAGTAVETTTDSVFQIGSITKVWTTTLLTQLADQGKLNLDAPLTDVLHLRGGLALGRARLVSASTRSCACCPTATLRCAC